MFAYKLLLIPITAVISYWMHIKARHWYHKTYAKHIVVKGYTPSHTIVDQWLTIKTITIISTMFLVWIVIGKGGLLIEYYGEFFFGMLIVGYTSSIGISTAALLIFKYAHQAKENLEGKVIIKSSLARQIALNITMIPLFSLTPCILTASNPFIIGGAIGIAINIFLQTISHVIPTIF